MQKNRLKGDFFSKKATKKPTKFRGKQTKKIWIYFRKTDYIFTIPTHDLRCSGGDLPSWFATRGESEKNIMKSLPVLFKGLLIAVMSSWQLCNLCMGWQVCSYYPFITRSAWNDHCNFNLIFTSGQPGHCHFKYNPSSCSCSITAIILSDNLVLRLAFSDILIRLADESQSVTTPTTLTPAFRRILAFFRLPRFIQLEIEKDTIK